MTPPVYLVYTTCADRDRAEALGRMLVTERLAACATAIPGGLSIYPWQGKVENAEECLVLLKTLGSLLPRLEKRLHELHDYECPEFVAVAADHVSAGYAEWVEASVRPADDIV
jgi:periplasmic divalent cation tolerance protein